MRTPIAREDGLPPIVADSPQARLLFRLWSGERMVQHSTGKEVADHDIEMLAEVVSHLHLRASYHVLVTSSSLLLRDTFGSKLTALVGPAGSYIAGLSALTYGFGATESVSHDGPRIVFCGNGLVDPERMPRFDLVVSLESAALSALSVLGHISVGDQLLVVNAGRKLKGLSLGDKKHVDVPVDVALAGGVESA